MSVPRFLTGVLSILLVSGSNIGCMNRAISEGIGVVTGASGKVVHIEKGQQLQAYRGFKVESLTVTPGLKVPTGIPSLIQEEFEKVSARKKLTPGGTPTLVLRGEVTNYETADVVDTAVGPLEECIIRAELRDGQTQRVLAVANLVSRAKSTTAGGAKNLSEGLGKGLSKWLKSGGIGTEEEQKEERQENSK